MQLKELLLSQKKENQFGKEIKIQKRREKFMKTIFKDGLFKNKVALITGGGTGIGLRTARELAALGATVVLASRKQEVIEKSVALIKKEGGKAYAVVCNLRDEESIINCVDKTLELAGTIDYLVNSGGGQFPAAAESLSKNGWNAVIETNLTGPFLLSKEIFNRVFEKKGGAIVYILINSKNGFPMIAHSGAARAGVENLVKSFANEWGRFGVRLNSIAPGPIDSSGLDNYPEMVKEMIKTEYPKNNQTYRLGTEEEIAASVLFLLSPAASFINGISLAVDGGEHIYNPIYPPGESENNAETPWKD